MTILPLRRLIASVDNGTWGSEPGTGDVDVACVRAADFDFPKLRVDLSRAPTRSIDRTMFTRLALRRGDLVLEKSGGGELAPVGRAVAFDSDVPAVTSNFAARVRPAEAVDSRFLIYLLQSLYSSGVTLRCVKQTTGIQNLDTGHWLQTPVQRPMVLEQRRIADFLDDRVARIDQIITSRNQQTALLEQSLLRASFDVVRGAEQSSRRDSGLLWLGTIPDGWSLLTVATEFQVDLGKMLDEKRQGGASAIPYLRNTNVQWDRVEISDLKQMDIGLAERERYCVRQGDLLICEGGQPGRSAVWSGELAPLGFQKALHRARSRGRSRPEWLLECLRVAAHLNVFAVENGQTTIGHLTNEQLRSLRLPFPDPCEQDRALDDLHSRRAHVRGAQAALHTGVALLQEYKQSLITAAVTGELDVTTAGSGIPG